MDSRILTKMIEKVLNLIDSRFRKVKDTNFPQITDLAWNKLEQSIVLEGEAAAAMNKIILPEKDFAQAPEINLSEQGISIKYYYT